MRLFFSQVSWTTISSPMPTLLEPNVLGPASTTTLVCAQNTFEVCSCVFLLHTLSNHPPSVKFLDNTAPDIGCPPPGYPDFQFCVYTDGTQPPLDGLGNLCARCINDNEYGTDSGCGTGNLPGRFCVLETDNDVYQPNLGAAGVNCTDLCINSDHGHDFANGYDLGCPDLPGIANAKDRFCVLTDKSQPALDHTGVNW